MSDRRRPKFLGLWLSDVGSAVRSARVAGLETGPATPQLFGRGDPGDKSSFPNPGHEHQPIQLLDAPTTGRFPPVLRPSTVEQTRPRALHSCEYPFVHERRTFGLFSLLFSFLSNLCH